VKKLSVKRGQLHYGNLELTYQPACEFAEGIKPAVLVIAGLAAMFIVSGVRTE